MHFGQGKLSLVGLVALVATAAAIFPEKQANYFGQLAAADADPYVKQQVDAGKTVSLHHHFSSRR